MADPGQKPNHFFQPMLSNFANTMSIPVAFYKLYFEGRGCEEVILRSGLRTRPWRVRLVGRRMVGGWRRFAEEHGLRVGYFLIFKYVGDFEFDVSVFDHSTCGKEYLVLDNVNVNHEDEDDDVVMLGGDGGLILDANDGEDEIKDVDIVEDDVDEKLYAEEDDDVQEDDEEEVANGGEPEGYIEPKSKRRRHYNVAGVGADCYVAEWKRSYAQSMTFPVKFTLANKLNDCSEIVIRDESENLWTVNVSLKRFTNMVYTTTGWGSFVENNKFKNGEMFQVRVISKGDIPILSFQRTNMIHRAKVQKSSKEGHDEESLRLVKKRNNGAKSCTHFYRISTEDTIERSRLFVNMEFGRSNNLGNKCGSILLKNSKGKTWNASLKRDGSTSTRYVIGTGWQQFALDNGLVPGCQFKLEIDSQKSQILTLKITRTS